MSQLAGGAHQLRVLFTVTSEDLRAVPSDNYINSIVVQHGGSWEMRGHRFESDNNSGRAGEDRTPTTK